MLKLLIWGLAVFIIGVWIYKCWGKVVCWTWGTPKEIKGKIIKGMGRGTMLGYPTVNMTIRKTQPGLYRIKHPQHGAGFAFVTEPTFAEVHFSKAPGDISDQQTLECLVVQKIKPGNKGIVTAMHGGLRFV